MNKSQPNKLEAFASLRAVVCDLNGILRGKRIQVTEYEKVINSGLRMPLSALGVDVWGEDVIGNAQVFETGDTDGVCLPTGRDLLPISWLPSSTALLPMWMVYENGDPCLWDPRQALAGVLAGYKSLGLRPVVATELEFYLTDFKKNYPRPPKSPCSGKKLNSNSILSLNELDQFEAFFEAVYSACAAQNIPVDSATSENGCGQFEINLLHTDDPLKAADDTIFFKNTVKGVAVKHGFAATFMAKPYSQQSGSGFHLHFSLLDEKGDNVFDDGTENGSQILQHALAGLLEAMPASTLLFAPHLNSYRRLRKGTHAPVAAAWGYENRTTAIRIPGGANKARRIEHRVAGADANPYLVITAILGAALQGIKATATAASPIEGDAYSQSLPLLPGNWDAALDAFEQCQTELGFFSEPLCAMLIACKKQEMNRFAAHVTDFEYQSYLDQV